MKYTVQELRLIKKMTAYSNEYDERVLFKLLKKEQAPLCKIIDWVGTDPRCFEAYRFCKLFCAISLEYAYNFFDENIPPMHDFIYHDISSMIAQNDPCIGKRAITFPQRIEKHVLKNYDFDEDDTFWLCQTISSFLIYMETYINNALK